MLNDCTRYENILTNVFHVISYDNEDNKWSLTRCEVSKISILLLVTRCQCILNRFLIDENDLGELVCLLLSGVIRNELPNYVFLVGVELFFTISS